MDKEPRAADPPGGNRSFVLRIWWERDKQARALRISIEDAETGEWHGFRDLGGLLIYLLEVIYRQQGEH